jgi:hypothetical protein
VAVLPWYGMVREAREEYANLRGTPKFDDADFLTLGIKPTWTRQQVIDQFTDFGFARDRPDPRGGQWDPIIAYKKVYGRADQRIKPQGFAQQIEAPSEAIRVYFDLKGAPSAVWYLYRDDSYSTWVMHWVNLRTGEVLDSRQNLDIWAHEQPPTK